MIFGKRTFWGLAVALSIGLVGGVAVGSEKKSGTDDSKKILTSTPRIISRVEWGAKPPNVDLFNLHKPNCITLHHGGVVRDPAKDPRESMRNLQAWCMRERPWGDVPYHYCVDLQGRIYEARPDIIAGDTNTEYDPTNHVLVEVMGNYEEQVPTQDQLDAVVQIMAYICRQYGISPRTIKSHKDYSEMTVCPGKHLYKYIENGYFIREVTAVLEREGNLPADDQKPEVRRQK